MRTRRPRGRRGATGVYRIRRRIADDDVGAVDRSSGSYDPRTTEDSYQEWWRDRPCEARQPTGGDAGTVPNPGRSSCEIRDPPRPFLREGSLGFSGSIERSGPPRWRRPTMTLETPTRPARAGRRPARRPAPIPCPRPPLSRVRPRRGARAELRLLRPASGRSRSSTTTTSRARALTREAIAARAPGIWRYLELLPVERAPGARPGRRLDRPRPGRSPRPGPGPRHRHDAPSQGRHPQPDAVVQGPGRRGRHGPRRRVRLRHARLRLDRQPRRCDRRRRGRRRPARLRLRPGRPRAGQDRARPELRRDGRPRRRDVRRHQPAQPRDRRRGGLGVRQRQPPAVLRRGQQDDRVRDRRAARLAPAGRPRRADRVGLDVHEDRQGLRRAGRDRPRRAQGRPVRRRPAGGLRAGRDRVRRGRRRDPAGPGARHDRPLARDRLAGRRRLRAGAGAADGRLDRVDPGRRDGRARSGGRRRTRGSSSRPPAA